MTLYCFPSVQPGMNNVLDYGLDRVTNPNEVKVNQVSLMHSGQGLGEVLRLGGDPQSICLRGNVISPWRLMMVSGSDF